MRKRVLASMLCMVLAVSAVGCGSSSDSSESVESADEVMEPVNQSAENKEDEEEKSAEESKEESTGDTEADGGVTWSFDEETYTLTISGSGDMEDYASYYDAPWCDLEYGYVVVEDGVTSVGNYAFCYYHLKRALLADSVTRIGDYAFYNCEYLSLNIPENCSIGRLALYDCDLAVDEDGFLIINNTLIQYSGNEENVVVPDGVTTISYSAMGDVNSFDAKDINSVFLPASVSSIDEQAFTGCEKMTAIYVDENNPYYKSIDGVLYSKDGQTLIYCPAGYGESYVIPNGVTTIGAYAFEDSSLTELTISSDVSFIGKGAFYDSDRSMNIIAEEGGAYYVDADGVLFTADGTTLIRGSWNVESYEIPDGVTSIEAYAFYFSTKLSSVALPDTLISIGDYAFSYCSNLAEIILPNSLTETGNYTFLNCALSSVTLSKSLTEIGEGTFMGCWMKEIDIPEGVTKIGARALSNTGLIDVELPETLEYIGHAAFSRCDSLNEISLPRRLEYIGAGAFSGADRLADVYYSVYCTDKILSEAGGALTDVYYGGSEEEWLAVEIHPVGNSLLTESVSIHFA